MKKLIIILITIINLLILSGCNKHKNIPTAIKNNDILVIDEYFNKYPEKINEVMINNQYPLLYAVETSSNIELIKLLVEKNADINILNNDNTSLSLSCANNLDEITKYLLTKKADTLYINDMINGEYNETINGINIYSNKGIKYIFNYQILNFIFYNETSINTSKLAVRILDFISIEINQYINENPNHSIEDLISYSKKYSDVMLLTLTCQLDKQYAQEADTKVLIETLELLKENNETITKETLESLFK